MFIHLHTHSFYSFLEGLASPKDLAQTAARFSMPALALTDHNGLSGAVEFSDACQDAGIQPIFGLEIDVAIPTKFLPISHTTGEGVLVVLATDITGWSNLCQLSSIVYAGLTTLPHQTLSFELLDSHSDGLICLTGGDRGTLSSLTNSGDNKIAQSWLGLLGELFPDNIYIELHNHTLENTKKNVALASLAHRLTFPMVATHNIYYLFPEQAQIQKVLSAIRKNQPIQTLGDDETAPQDAFFTDVNEMVTRFKHFPEAIYRTNEIAERCQLTLPLGTTLFPEVSLPEGKSANQVLRQKSETGARRLYKSITPELRERLELELSTIKTSGYAPLFLVMEEIIQYARQKGIPISSRGSAASSLIAHCLGITDPDPMRLNLYFERFLNTARKSPPDIDTDLCSRRRDEVIKFVYQRYGDERVAMVCTVIRFRKRSALREVAKAYGLSPSEVSGLAAGLPQRWYGPPDKDTKIGKPFGEISERYNSPRFKAIFRNAAAILGIPRHLSIHPGGIVIAPVPMTNLVPTQLATKGVVITQFDLDSIKRFGLVKIDLLGIRGLTVLGDVAHEIETKQVDKLHSSLQEVLDSIPEDDPDTSELVQQGRTIGCFQIESPGMRTTLKEIQARGVDDIMVALALYRPGPLTGGLKDAFVRRHRGLEPPKFLHPSLKSLLGDTYGVILYQEQVLRIAHELAGLSLADADLLRRAMSHFDPGKQMITLKNKFIAGAFFHNNVPAEIASKIWELMAAFAGYGFPKAHAASYAQLAWRLAWCKTNYPAQFMAAVLANWGGYYNQSVYLMEARRLGLKIHPPHINRAKKEFSVGFIHGDQALIMGLDQVRGLTQRTISQIIRQGPFDSLTDFMARVNPNPREVGNLIQVGAFEEIGTIPGLLHHLETGNWRSGQLPMFSNQVISTGDWTLEEKATAQQKILGVSIIVHPLELYESRIETLQAVSTTEASTRINQRMRVAGMRQTWRRVRTSQNELVFYMSMEDPDGMMDVVVDSSIYQKYRTELKGNGPFVIEGIVETTQSRVEPFLRAIQIWNLTSDLT